MCHRCNLRSGLLVVHANSFLYLGTISADKLGHPSCHVSDLFHLRWLGACLIPNAIDNDLKNRGHVRKIRQSKSYPRKSL